MNCILSPAARWNRVLFIGFTFNLIVCLLSLFHGIQSCWNGENEEEEEDKEKTFEVSFH